MSVSPDKRRTGSPVAAARANEPKGRRTTAFGPVQVRGIEYDIAEFLQSCVDRYLELANKTATSLRNAPTPFLEITVEDHEHQERGELQPIAARVLMKILGAARMARYDLLRPTCYLAAKITK